MPAPTPMALNDVIAYRLGGLVNGQNTLTTLTYRVSALDAVTDYISAMVNVLAAFHGGTVETTFKACLPTNFTITKSTVQRVYPRPISRAIAETRTVLGTFASVCDAQGTASTFSRQTQNAGKNQRASMHVPATPNTAQAAGLLTSGFQTVLDAYAAATTITIPFGTTGVLTPVIYHLKADVGPALKTDDIFTYRLNNTVRTERRRVIGYGK